MYIITKKEIDLHWWGNSILLVKNLEDYYIFTPEEVLLLKYFSISNDIDKTIESISNDLAIEKGNVADFVEIFFENFIFYFDKVQQSQEKKLYISGKQGMYYPLELHVSLTNACTQHCIHCYKSANSVGTNIDVDALRIFLDKVCGIIPYLTFSGGEPTLHPHFLQLLNEYHDKFFISVLTSGNHINPQILDSLGNAKLGVTVSIYSCKSEIHDHFTGVKGSLQSILDFVKSAISKGIEINVSTILSTDNFEDIVELIAQLENLGVKSVAVGRVTLMGRAAQHNWDKTIPHRDIFLQQVKKLGHMFPSVNLWADDIQQCDTSLSMFRCPAGTLVWAVYENGEIHPCAICSKPELKIGDITQFNDVILHSRDCYERKLAELPYMNLPKDRPCPFINET